MTSKYKETHADAGKSIEVVTGQRKERMNQTESEIGIPIESLSSARRAAPLSFQTLTRPSKCPCSDRSLSFEGHECV